MPSYKVHKEFSRELIAFQDTCGLTAAEFSGMLMGAAVVWGYEAGISKGQLVALVAKQCDREEDAQSANDNE